MHVRIICMGGYYYFEMLLTNVCRTQYMQYRIFQIPNKCVRTFQKMYHLIRLIIESTVSVLSLHYIAHGFTFDCGF